MGWAVTFTVTWGSQLMIHFVQLLIRVTAILVIFKVVFVVYGHVECQNGQFVQFWIGCVIHSNLWKPVIHLLFPVTDSCDSNFGYL